jgi:hypothetical protein
MPALRACLFAAAVLGAISGSLAAGQPAQRQRTNSLRSMSGEFQALVERVRPAVVQIVTSGFVAAGAQWRHHS